MSKLIYEQFNGVYLVPWENNRRVGKGIIGPVKNHDDYPDFFKHQAYGNQLGSEPKSVTENNYHHIDTLCVYGGILDFRHFGHVAAEFVHRLWVCRLCEEEHIVIFVAMAGTDVTQIPDFFKQMMTYFGVKHWKILFEPNYVERLIVGEQGKQLGRVEKEGYGHFLASLEPRLIGLKVDLPEKIAVLRDHFDGNVTGRFLGEKALKAVLLKEGYVAFRPEEHPLEHQLAVLLHARKIVISEGSALHLFDLLSRTHADVAVIKRRQFSKLDEHSLLGKAKSLYIFKEVYFILHRNKDKNLDFNRSLSYASLTDIMNFLVEHGFIKEMHEARGDFYDEVLKYLQINDGYVDYKVHEADKLVEQLLKAIATQVQLNTDLKSENEILSAKLHLLVDEVAVANKLLLESASSRGLKLRRLIDIFKRYFFKKNVR
jgi:hypothetical protein